MSHKNRLISLFLIVLVAVFSSLFLYIFKKNNPCEDSYSLEEKKLINSHQYDQVNQLLRTKQNDDKVVVCYRQISQKLIKENKNIDYILLYEEGMAKKKYDFYNNKDWIVIPLNTINPLSDLMVEFYNKEGNLIQQSNPIFLNNPKLSDMNKVNTLIKSENIQDKISKLNLYNPQKYLPMYYDLGKKVLNNLIYVNLIKKEVLSVDFNYQTKIVNVHYKDGSVQSQRGTNGPLVIIKYHAAFNTNQFLWDDTFISWFLIDFDKELAYSTLDFWYSLQVEGGKNSGLIPREIRTKYYNQKDNYLHNFDSVNKVFFNTPQSDNINNSFIISRVELDLYNKYGDINRLKKILPKLINYFNWVEQNRKIDKNINDNCQYYYWNTNLSSGMDNSPRGENNYQDFAWLDIFAQQQILANDIMTISKITGEIKTEQVFAEKSTNLKNQFRSCHFSATDYMFYDILPSGQFDKENVTAAFLWGLLTESINQDEKDKLINNWVKNEKKFGGDVILPSISRSSQEFSKKGDYWRGGAWPPLWGLLIYSTDNDSFKEEILDVFWNVWKKEGDTFEYYSPTLENGEFTKGDWQINNIDMSARVSSWGWGVLPLGIKK